MTGATNVLSTGFLLHEYRVDSVLGAGGFGITYKAWDTHLNTWVAIKEYFPAEWCYRSLNGTSVLPNTRGVGQEHGEQIFDYQWGISRFLEEARVLARVQSPHVVRVKRYFKAHGSAYIVMDYEEGEPLNRCLKRVKVLDEPSVMALLRDVLPGLQSVHDQGFLHRDIKPSNLYVRHRDGCVMLIDFGAARQAIGRLSQSITGLVTPGYSPPEQYAIRSDRYGTWTDIYALGAVLYRCVSGQPPMEAAERLLDDQLLPAREVAAGDYSSALLAAIDRALAVRPEERFQSAWEMQDALPYPDAASIPHLEEQQTRPSVGLLADVATRISPPPLQLSDTALRRQRWPWWLGIPLSMALAAGVLFETLKDSFILGTDSPGEQSLPLPDVSITSTSDVEASVLDATPSDDRTTNDSMVIPESVIAQGSSSLSRVPEPGDEFIETRINMPMVWIPSGCFQMGSPITEEHRDVNEAQHRHCLEGFWLGRFEVTNAQFRQFREPHDSNDYVKSFGFNDDAQPVVRVNWDDASAFADWLSITTGQSYRLADEIEWEYAARAGTTTTRFWGDAAEDACDYANVDDRSYQSVVTESGGHTCDDGVILTAPVGNYQPNPWGLYDMLGNVWEWTCSVYQEDASAVSTGCPSQGETRVIRGSSWVGVPQSTRVAHRRSHDPAQVEDVIGFRLLREERETP